MLDDITNADNADQISVGDHGQMPDAVTRHQAYGALQVSSGAIVIVGWVTISRTAI